MVGMPKQYHNQLPIKHSGNKLKMPFRLKTLLNLSKLLCFASLKTENKN
jgi:hypothetical protein